MLVLPESPCVLVLRTDFSDDEKWADIVAALQAPSEPEGYYAALTPVEHRGFEAMTWEAIKQAAPRPFPDWGHPVVFVADSQSMSEIEGSVLVIDMKLYRRRPFRAIPEAAWMIENNLSLSNMDYHEFANEVDPDGIFRDFYSR